MPGSQAAPDPKGGSAVKQIEIEVEGVAACVLDVPSGPFAAVAELEHPVCSIYPGTLVARPDRGQLLISYGPAEYRSPVGVEYATRVARVIHNRGPLLAVLARMHSEGDKQ